MTERRAFALCLDGENLELLEGFRSAFSMPHIGALLDGGRRGALDPWINPLTPPSWTTFQTGTWFPRHGVLGFVQHDPATHRDVLVRSGHIRDESFLLAADRQGVSVVSLNLPMTYPPPVLRHGAVVSGFDAPGDQADFASPAGLADRLRAAFPGYSPCHPPGNPDGRRRAERMDYLEALRHHVETRQGALRLLLSEVPARIVVVQCQETDLIHHIAWDLVSDLGSAEPREREALRGIYEGVDVIAGILREHCGGDDGLGLIVSDHGGAPGGWLLQANVLLAEWGFAVPLPGADGSLARADEVGRSLGARVRRRVRSMAGRLVDEPGGMRGGEVNRELQLDWKRTRAFVGVGDHLGLVYAGDGPPLTPDEVDGLARRFLEHRLSDGSPSVAEVLRGETVFVGARDEPILRPVLALVPADGVYIGRRSGGAAVTPMPHPSRGLHRRMGMFCWSGRGVVPGMAPEPMPMTAVYPTLFAGLGLAVPEGLDGAPVPEVVGLPGGVPTLTPAVQPQATPDTDEDDTALRERLEGLGYLG